MKGIYSVLHTDDNYIDVFSIEYNQDSTTKFDIEILADEKSGLPENRRPKTVDDVINFFKEMGTLTNFGLNKTVDIAKNENLDLLVETFSTYYSTYRSGMEIVGKKTDTTDDTAVDQEADAKPEEVIDDVPVDDGADTKKIATKNDSKFSQQRESDEAGHATKGSIKKLPTEQRVVKDTKKGAYVRNQHVNKNDGASNGSTRTANSPNDNAFDFSNGFGKVKGMRKRGITSGVKKVEANGHKFFAKPTSGEKQVDGGWMRSSVRLNDKVTGEQVTDKYRVHADQGSELGEKYKGTMTDREVMAYKLSQELGMDHLPETRKGVIDGEEHAIMMDVRSQYKDKFSQIVDRDDWGGRSELYDLIAKDKNIGDKIVFDYILGNTDRHTGNMFAGITDAGDVSMIGIDHGLSFPFNNRKYLDSDRGNQVSFNGPLSKGKARASEDFANRVADFYKSGKMEEFATQVAENIGHQEADAFIDRIGDVLKAAIKRGIVKV